MPLLFPDAPDDVFVEGTLVGDVERLRDTLRDIAIEIEQSPAGSLVARTLSFLSSVFYR